ncbi:MAG: hypothetical protein AAGJ52_05425 [Pseudomonadota bacterium]
MRCLAAVLLAVFSTSLCAQNLDDPRLDPGIRDWIGERHNLPVVVRLAPPMSAARDTWRLLRRAVGTRYGEIEQTPNGNREFFARVDRNGLAILLSVEQVEAVYRPFEMTLPGED